MINKANYSKAGAPIYSKSLSILKWKVSVDWILCFCTIIFIHCILILSSVPPISRDALIHHLAIPKMYLLHGGMYEIPSMHFSYFPMNLDMLYLLPLYFNYDIAAKYIHFLFALLTAGLLYRYLKNVLDSRTYSLMGALFFLTIPVIVKLSVTAYVDLGLIFFSWACLYSFLKWHDSDFKHRYLILAGVSCGLALGTKYNGLILLLIMAALIPLAYSRKQNSQLAQRESRLRNINSLKGVIWSVTFILISLILFSPWMARNTLWKNNPIYPLYNNVFNPPVSVAISTAPKEESQPQNAFWMRRHVYNESFTQTLLIPIRAFFQGQDDNPKYFDGKLNPCLLLLPLISFVYLRNKSLVALKIHRTIFSLFSVIFTLFVLFQADFRIRYMAPAIPPLIVLSVFGIKNMVDYVSLRSGYTKWLGWVVIVVLVIFAFTYNGKYIYGQFGTIRPWDYLSKKIDRDGYISRYRFEHPVIMHANQILPKDARVLCLSIGDRTYYIERAVHLAEDFYDRKDGTFSENDLLQKLRRYGTTHIIFYKPAYLNWSNSLKKEERVAYENVFQKNTKLLYEKNGVQLLELRKNG